MTATTANDTTIELGTLQDHEFIGEDSLLLSKCQGDGGEILQHRRTSTVVAISNCILLKLSQEHFQTFLKSTPEFG